MNQIIFFWSEIVWDSVLDALSLQHLRVRGEWSKRTTEVPLKTKHTYSLKVTQ